MIFWPGSLESGITLSNCPERRVESLRFFFNSAAHAAQRFALRALNQGLPGQIWRRSDEKIRAMA